MNKMILNAIIAVAVAAVIGFLFGFVGSVLHIQWGFEATLLPTLFGAFTFYILFNLSGTRKDNKADATMRADALKFAAPAGQARVYVLRTGFAGKAAGMDVSMDGAPLAQLKAPRFTMVDLTPGAHECRAAFSGGAGTQNRQCSVKFDAAAGTVTVLRISVSLGMLKNELIIAPVALDSARADILKATMVAAQPTA